MLSTALLSQSALFTTVLMSFTTTIECSEDGKLSSLVITISLVLLINNVQLNLSIIIELTLAFGSFTL